MAFGRAREFKGTQRFALQRRLGAGGMGEVFEALDRERNRPVALKVLRETDPEALLHFKNEFRSLQNIRHPNLVTLGELFEEDGRWFFTMELVDGVNFLRWVRPPERRDQPVPFDEHRLRESARQLAVGVIALHEANKVHRDIKPSNVLVSATGRVVLLDFGFVTDLAANEPTGWRVVGTADYMAPEQATPAAVGPAADWYSVGVVLYRALTGRLPFTGKRLEVLLKKQRLDPRPPRAIAPATPADLNQLVTELLRFAPTERPASHQIARRLGCEPDAIESVRRLDRALPVFVGRHHELAALVAALDASTAIGRAVYITGESGIGKSTLVDELGRVLRRERPTALVLGGRCYERESVRYKAFDGVIDQLSAHLRRLPREVIERLVPEHAGLLADVFPVLRRVERFAAAGGPGAELDPIERRARVFAALRSLLQALARRGPVAVVIEDLQWADADSLALLETVLSAPAGPSLLLVATGRGAHPTAPQRDDAAGAIERAFGEYADTIRLGPLSADEGAQLARELLPAGRDARVAESIALEAGGHPLFIGELALDARTSDAPAPLARLDEALWRRVVALTDQARKVLEIAVTAGTPLAQEVAALAADLDFGELPAYVAELRENRFVRTGGARRVDTVEPYHDRVRQVVFDRLGDDGRGDCHWRLALAHEATHSADAELLAFHWEGAGEHERAAEYAAQAAEQAAAGLAFQRAATLYRRCLQLRPREDALGRRLKTRLADALANAGRGVEAAAAYIEAAFGSSTAAALELKRRAAEQLLRSGHIEDGLAAMRGVLESSGLTLPRTPRRALWAYVAGRARLRLRGMRYHPRDATQVSLEQLTLIDICWSMAIGLSLVDPLRGGAFQPRHLKLALDAGEPGRLCRALATEVGYAAASGAAGQRRAARLLAEARRLATATGDPKGLGFVDLSTGIAALLDGRWREALDACEAADATFRDHCVGVQWERDSAQLFGTWALGYLGQIRELGGRVRRLLVAAQRRGDRFAATNLRTGLSNLTWLVEGDVDGARLQLDNAMRDWSRQAFYLQHYYDLIARTLVDLYAGDIEPARARLELRWPALSRAQLLRVQLIRVLALTTRASVAITRAAAGEADAVRPAAADVRALRREDAAWAAPLAHMLGAGLDAAGGRPEPAVDALRAAVEGFRQADMWLYVHVVRWRLGHLVGGDEGAEQVASAERWMRGEGIASPPRMAAALVPGFANV